MATDRDSRAENRPEPVDFTKESAAGQASATTHASIPEGVPEGACCMGAAIDAKGRGVLCGAPATTIRLIGGVAMTMCADCAAVDDAREPPAPKPVERLDWTDDAAVRVWLRNVREAWDDADAVTRDVLKPERERRLGQREHERLYRDAAASMAELLAYAERRAP